MGCLMSCSSSARKNHHHHRHYSSTTDDSTATLAPYKGCHPARCLAKKPNPTAEIHNGTTTHRKGKGARRRRQDDIPKLPKTFFMMGQQSSEGSRPFTPTTADPFSESISESTESPIHWGIWRRKEVVYTIPLASEFGSFTCPSPIAPATPPLKRDYAAVPEIIREAEKVGSFARERLEAFTEKRRLAAARQRSEFGFGCGMFQKDLGGEVSPAWTPVVGSFAMRSPARGGSPFNVSGRATGRWSGRAIGSGVRIQFVNDDVRVKRCEDQSVDDSYLSMECFVF
ncbi:unnamed protein product [Linum trigynum]|uniref:Uncharacterized protein n=1 Tax=Linum trigynum TaxID=586398 RepID=A0AAV2G9Y6_9ROSI